MTAVSDQVAHWLFAFDAAGMATFRALALIAVHPSAQKRAQDEIAEARTGGAVEVMFLRACLLESVRLWPTTPAILRETMQETFWERGALPAGTHLLIFVSYFDRDDENLPYAHRFTPELWLRPSPSRSWPPIPFSEGPGACLARHLVPLTGSIMMAAILKDREITLNGSSPIQPDRDLPGTLDHFALSLGLRAR